MLPAPPALRNGGSERIQGAHAHPRAGPCVEGHSLAPWQALAQGPAQGTEVPEPEPRIGLPVQREGVRDVGEGHETLDRDRVEDADFVAAQEPLEVLVGAVVPRMHEHDAPRFDKGCAEGSEVEEPRTGDGPAAGDDDRVHGVGICES